MGENKMKNQDFNEKYFIETIKNYDFNVSSDMIKQLPYDDIERLLLKIGFDYEQNLTLYAFICHLIKKHECIEYHMIAQSILCGPLCHIDGAYRTALYHNRTVLDIDKNNLNGNLMMLFYSTLSEPLIDKKEAMEYAYNVLKIEPDNAVALNFLQLS